MSLLIGLELNRKKKIIGGSIQHPKLNIIMTIKRRPTAGEFGDYYQKYISLVDGEDIVPILIASRDTFLSFLKELPADKWDYSYRWGKWTIKEVLLHLIDTERIFAYRALRIARTDGTPLPGYEQDDYVPASEASSRTPASIIEEYEAVRNASIQQFKNLPLAAFDQIGTASENPLSPLAAAYIIAGHQQHHLNLFEERYL